jgi:hypothetical protein
VNFILDFADHHPAVQTSIITEQIEPENDFSDKNKAPKTQACLIALYNDLQTAFQLHKDHDPHGKTINITPRIMDVAWIKDEFQCDVIWGMINIETNEVPLMILEEYGTKKRLQAVHIGALSQFPMSSSTLYYCYDDDMIYYHPLETYINFKRGPYHLVSPLRSFSSILDDFR